jgi:hypothetical protein
VGVGVGPRGGEGAGVAVTGRAKDRGESGPEMYGGECWWRGGCGGPGENRQELWCVGWGSGGNQPEGAAGATIPGGAWGGSDRVKDGGRSPSEVYGGEWSDRGLGGRGNQPKGAVGVTMPGGGVGGGDRVRDCGNSEPEVYGGECSDRGKWGRDGRHGCYGGRDKWKWKPEGLFYGECW